LKTPAIRADAQQFEIFLPAGREHPVARFLLLPKRTGLDEPRSLTPFGAGAKMSAGHSLRAETVDPSQVLPILIPSTVEAPRNGKVCNRSVKPCVESLQSQD
jgi:hypothetical protein